jgi:hypothetical protein
MRNFCLTMVALLSAVDVSAAGSPVVIAEPSQDRWMYPSNSTPGTRAQASTFSALPGSAGLDDRWGFYLFAFHTAAVIPAGLPPGIYQIHSIKVRATIGQERLFRYDPSYDSWLTHGTPTVPASVADGDAGRPLELHGAGFRGTWTSSTFLETSPYGSSIPGNRNAYPMGFDAAGVARDVSNNITGQFDSVPWSIGKTHSLAAEEWVPIDSTFDFDVDTALPGVNHYLRQGLATGRVWFSLTSLHPATQQGGEFVAWYTKDDIYHQLFGGLAPQLVMEASLNIPLTILRDGNQVTVTWPEFAGFTHTLQASHDLTDGSWLPVHSHAAAVNGSGVFSENTGTRPRFFRLALSPTPAS